MSLRRSSWHKDRIFSSCKPQTRNSSLSALSPAPISSTNLLRRVRLVGFPTFRNGVFQTLPPTPTLKVTKVNQSFGARDVITESREVLITQCLRFAALAVMCGRGVEMTRMRSRGGQMMGRRGWRDHSGDGGDERYGMGVLYLEGLSFSWWCMLGRGLG